MRAPAQPGGRQAVDLSLCFVSMHDHIVVGKEGHASPKELKLI